MSVRRPKILFVTANPPYPTRSGDRQRTNLIARALATISDLNLIAIAPPAGRFAEATQMMTERFGLIDELDFTPRGRRGPWRLLRPASPSKVDRLATAVGRRRVEYTPDPAVATAVAKHVAKGGYDLVVGRYLKPSMKAGLPDHPPTILDVDDLDTQMYASRLAAGGLSTGSRIVNSWHLRQLQSFVPGMLQRFDHLWVPAPDDVAATGHANVSVLPNIPYTFANADDDALVPVPAESTVVLCVATMNFAPNLRGLEWFLANVWPAVRNRVPTATFRVVGGGITNAMRATWGAIAGVQVVGSVDKLRAEYDGCALSVAPILEGGGTKIKVAESLRFGRVPVTHAHAFRGYERVLSHGESIWVAGDAAAMTDGIVRLLTDAPLRDAIAAKGRAAVFDKLSFDAFTAEVSRTVDDVLARRPRRLA